MFGLIRSYIRVQCKAENHLKIDDTTYSVDDFKSETQSISSLHSTKIYQNLYKTKSHLSEQF